MSNKYPQALQLMVLRDDGAGNVETFHMTGGAGVVYRLSLGDMLSWSATLNEAIARHVRARAPASGGRLGRLPTGEGT